MQPQPRILLGDKREVLGTARLCWGGRTGARASPAPSSRQAQPAAPPRACKHLLPSRSRMVAVNPLGCQRRRGALWPLCGQRRVPLSASQAEGTVSVPMCTRSGHQVALPSMCPRVHIRGTSPELPPPDSHKAPVTAAAFCLNSLCYLIQELHLIER